MTTSSRLPQSARSSRSTRSTGTLASTLVLALGAGAASAAPVVRQAGGELGGAVVAGDRLYVGQGPAVVTWALSPDGSAPPARIDTTDPLPGMVHGLAIRGAYLYAAWEVPYPTGEIGIYSLADPDHPAHVADFAYSAEPFLRPGGLLVLGEHLLLGDPETGLYSFSIADPVDPKLATHLPVIGVDRLAVTGSRLVAWGRTFLGTLLVQVFDVADPSEPSPLGTYSGGNYFDAAVAGDLLVLVGDGLEVVSLADPADPTWLATEPSVAARTVALVAGHALFGDAAGAHAWSLANPSAPVEVDVVAAPADRASRIALHAAGGGTAILLTEMGRGLAVDVSTPSALGLDHVFDLPGAFDATGVVESGGQLFVSDFYSGLKILDPTLATTGRADPTVALGAFEDVAVEGATAHLANWGSGLVTVDVADPSSPEVLGDLPFDAASAIDVDGDAAFLASSTGESTFGVVDVSDPSSPQLQGTMPVLHSWDVLFHQGRVLLADDASGLLVLDVDVPQAPQQIGQYGGCDSAIGVAASGDLAAVACSNGTLHLVDFADPTQPAQLGVYTSPGTFMGRSAALDRGLAYYGHTGGVDLVDVSDPTSPRLLREVALASDVRDLALSSDGTLWVAGGLGGVYEVAVVVFRDGFETGDTSAWSAALP